MADERRDPRARGERARVAGRRPRLGYGCEVDVLTAGFWRSRRAVSVAGIVFAVLLIAAMTMVRIAVTEPSFGEIQQDAGRRTLIGISLSLVPFAGIAFLWFIG